MQAQLFLWLLSLWEIFAFICHTSGAIQIKLYFPLPRLLSLLMGKYCLPIRHESFFVFAAQKHQEMSNKAKLNNKGGFDD